MARKKYYAYITPAGSGICNTWEECKAACDGYKNAKYKGFPTFEEAFRYAFPDTPFHTTYEDKAIVSISNTKPVPERKEEISSNQSEYRPFISKNTPISNETTEFCRIHFPNLSKQQKIAVQCVNGKTLLFAVPGSGKTTVIIARIGFMVYSRKIDPRRIISLTFTKAAANEMVARYKAKFNAEIVPDFRTIHSLCYSIILPKLKLAGYAFPENLIGVEQDSEEEERPFTNSHICRSLFKLLRCQPKDFETAMEAVQCIITGIKNSVMTPDRYSGRIIKIDGQELNIGQLFQTYQVLLQKLNCMDYDDLLIHAYNGLRNCPDVLRELRNKYSYWCVDEAQDTSLLQFKLLELLYGKDGNVFMVGDDDQSIYSFRGANPKLLLEFGHKQDVTTLLMGCNYRSDHGIVATAKEFIKNNQYRVEKEMFAHSCLPGTIFIPQTLRTEADQYSFIVHAAQEAINKSSSLAVLYRRNISVLPVIVYLHRHSIPYEANRGIAEILRSKHIKAIWKIFQLINSPTSIQTFISCHKYLRVNLSKTELEALKKSHEDDKKAHILNLILQIHLENDNAEETENLKKLITLLSKISQLRPTAAAKAILSEIYVCSLEHIGDRLRIYSFLSACDLYETISDFVNDLCIILSEEKKEGKPDPTDIDNSLSTVTTTERPIVTLSSMHSSKGREFNRVIIIDSFDEIMPGKGRDDTLIYDSEEELRLFYVAITRAIHRIDILTVEKYHGNSEIISRFISDFAYLSSQSSENASIFDIIPDETETDSSSFNIEPQKYYAVKKGRNPGIYTLWGDCQNQVNGFSGSEFKSFPSKKEAEEYLGLSVTAPQNTLSLNTFEDYIVGSDGIPFNKPVDLPAVINESIHSYIGTASIKKMDPVLLGQLREQSNYMYGANTTTVYQKLVTAYVLTYLPVNYYKIWKPLYDLARSDELKNHCKILELGVGPGTATLGLISFYSELALSNPDIQFVLDITAVEKEPSFQPIFNILTNKLIDTCAPNIKTTINLIHADVLADIPVYSSKYDLIVESNMLNISEGMEESSIDKFRNVLDINMAANGIAILIEPGQIRDKQFLENLTANVNKKFYIEQINPPKIIASNTKTISLYNEAVDAGLRRKKNDLHWFSYLMLKRRSNPQ